MSEKKYTLPIPPQLLPKHDGHGGFSVRCDQIEVTKEEARSLRDQCAAIEAQSQEPEVRIGDIWVDNLDGALWCVNLTVLNESNARNWGRPSGTAVYCNPTCYHYVGNLHDLLVKGEIRREHGNERGIT